MFFHDASRKTRTCKISTFFEDLSFLNPRSYLQYGNDFRRLGSKLLKLFEQQITWFTLGIFRFSFSGLRKGLLVNLWKSKNFFLRARVMIVQCLAYFNTKVSLCFKLKSHQTGFLQQFVVWSNIIVVQERQCATSLSTLFKDFLSETSTTKDNNWTWSRKSYWYGLLQNLKDFSVE